MLHLNAMIFNRLTPHCQLNLFTEGGGERRRKHATIEFG